MSSPVLGVMLMQESQSLKHVTVNDAIGDLELIAGRASVAVSPTTGTMTLTADQSRVGLLELTGTLTGALAVEFVAGMANLVVVHNGTSGAYALTVKMAGNATTLVIPKGCSVPVRLGTSVALDKRHSIVMPKLLAQLNADQAVTQSLETRIDYDTVTVDPAGAWDAANKRYVCPVAGWYEVSANVQTVTTGVMVGAMQSYIGVRKNGSVQRYGTRHGDGDTASADQQNHITVLLLCAAGDTLDAVGYCGRSGTTFLGFKGVGSKTWVTIRCVELA